MEKGFLLLVGNYYDLVHYIEVDGVYYTLSRDNVEKITDINEGVEFYIKKVTLTELEESRKVDPYYLEQPKLSEQERDEIIASTEYHPITIAINNDSQVIEDFQALSVKEEFAYFKDLSEETVVLLEYKQI